MEPVNERKSVVTFVGEISTPLGSHLGHKGGSGGLLEYQRRFALAPRHRLELGGGASFRGAPVTFFESHGHGYVMSPGSMPSGAIPRDPDRRPVFIAEVGCHALVDYRYAWGSSVDVGAVLDIAGLWVMGIMPSPDNSEVHSVRGAVQFGPTLRLDPLSWLAFNFAAGLRINSTTVGREDSPAGLFFRWGVGVIF